MEDKILDLYNIQKDELLFLLAGAGMEGIYGFTPGEQTFHTEEEEKVYFNMMLFHLIQRGYLEIESIESGQIGAHIKEPMKTGVWYIKNSKACLKFEPAEDQMEGKVPALFYLGQEGIFLAELLETRENGLACASLSWEDLWEYLRGCNIFQEEVYSEKAALIDEEKDKEIYRLSAYDTKNGKLKARIRLVENYLTNYLIEDQDGKTNRTIYGESNLKKWILSAIGETK